MHGKLLTMAEPGDTRGLRARNLRAGRLLVANPLLPDPNFDRTVVLVLGYGEEGAIGVVLNRPSDTTISSPLPSWAHLAADPPVVFVGGPVQPQAVICLAQPADAPARNGWSPVTPDLGTVDLDGDPVTLQAELSQVRFFAGYAGWDAGQLESEISAGAWWVLDGGAEDAFSDDPATLWETVLRRQGGPLAMVALFPDDPRLN
jgi:putative transcriptional regulator